MSRPTVLAVVLLAGCAEASIFDHDPSEPIDSAMAQLVESSLERNPWTEEDRVFCDQVGVGEDDQQKSVGEYTRLPGRDGDIFVIRTCNEVERIDGELFRATGDECSTRISILENTSSLFVGCFEYDHIFAEQVAWWRADQYVKHLGNKEDFAVFD